MSAELEAIAKNRKWLGRKGHKYRPYVGLYDIKPELLEKHRLAIGAMLGQWSDSRRIREIARIDKNEFDRLMQRLRRHGAEIKTIEKPGGINSGKMFYMEPSTLPEVYKSSVYF